LRKNVRRIAVVLEKLAEIESQDSDEELLSWPESKREETEVQGSKKKGKQKKQSSNRAEEEKDIREQEKENRMEGLEEGSSSFSPAIFSVRGHSEAS